jgi:hypothetical protein
MSLFTNHNAFAAGISATNQAVFGDHDGVNAGIKIANAGLKTHAFQYRGQVFGIGSGLKIKGAEPVDQMGHVDGVLGRHVPIHHPDNRLCDIANDARSTR